jgi:hypothetical protein
LAAETIDFDMHRNHATRSLVATLMSRSSSPFVSRIKWLTPVVVLAVIGISLVDPLRRSDLMVFLRAANDVTSGANPYTPTSDPFLWHGSAYVYPYLTSYLFVPLTWVPIPVADVIWFCLSAAAVVGGCWILKLRDPIGIAAVLASATCIRSFQVGAINALLFLAAAALWRYRDNPRVAPVAFTVLAGSKLFLLPVSLWIFLTRPRRIVLMSAGALGTFLIAGALLMPISVAEFVKSMSLLSSHEGPQSMSTLRWFSPLFPGPVAKALPLALALGTLIAAGLYRHRHPAHGDKVLFSATILASLMATPIYWSHYTVLAATIVLLASPTRRAAILFSLATWAIALPVLAPPIPQLPLVVRLPALFGGAAIAVLMSTHYMRRAPISAAA